MCGIAGIMLAGSALPDAAILDRFEHALGHRGPDGTGRFADRGIGLINTRLAIIDLAHGDQPFVSPDGAVLVANGEIYNDQEIRKQNGSYPYRSASDCESPLHLFEANGLDFVRKLRGMYAIAIYDRPNDRLVIARDPFGIKPLYYVRAPGYFAFASEPEALLAAGLARRQMNARKGRELLQLKFNAGASSIFDGVERVLPGETLVVSKGEIVERRRQPIFVETGTSISAETNPLTALDAILEESVRVHIRSDVPYGLFLSGGIDSSLLLAMMARVIREPVIAFTAAFPGSGGADESERAARVAKAVGAEHDIVGVTAKDFWELSPQVALALDDPTTDAASIPTYKLAARAKQAGVKVVLSGEGADEIFAGYSRYRRVVWSRGLLGRKTRTHGVLDALIDGRGEKDFAGWRADLDLAERDAAGRLRSALRRVQAIDSAEWLPNDLLVKLDRTLMAHGVEGRTPFLDPVVAQFAFNLPDDLKVRKKFGKWLLRQWLAANLPSADAYAKKTGFNPPVGQWIAARRRELEQLVPKQPGIVELSLGDVARKALAQAEENPQAAWSLVFFALWHNVHILRIAAQGSIGDVLSEAAKA